MSNYTAKDFYNDELSRLKAKQQNTEVILNSQERLAMLNDSYRKRYAKYVQILMVLVCAVLIYLGVVILQKTFPTIPQVAIDIVTIILMFLVIFYLFSAFWELYSRSSLNYDELDLPSYDASGVDVSELAAKGQVFNFLDSTNGNLCVGSACCPGFYDSEKNVCISTNKTATPTVQTFTTLEYEKIETAYTDVTFNSPSLKRKPNSNNVAPLPNTTVLTYSTF